MSGNPPNFPVTLPSFRTFLCLVTLAAASPLPVAPAAESELWGKAGEKWSPAGNLPDFSWAGYHHGEEPPPHLPPGKSVKDFGATGDGVTDDSAAFLKALAEVNGAIEVPAGRYVIRQILEITRSGVVLRGEGPQKSILVCPIPLNDVKEDWGATTGGERTSNYSWSGGFVSLRGEMQNNVITKIMRVAKRGDHELTVGGTSHLSLGQQVIVQVKDTPENTLAAYLYSGDSGNITKLEGKTHAYLICRITAIDPASGTIWIDRPLRFDTQLEWLPVVKSLSPTVTESGVESLGFEFPPTPYGGHFKELGQNPLAMNGVMNCWARDLEFVNPDSGPFINSVFCTIRGITYKSVRPADAHGYSGHHGIYFGGDDNVFADFDFQTKFIHDLSVSHCAGNVIENGRGVDLSFDHHRRAPYENLYTNLDAGSGSRLWMCGGGYALGKHCGARGTFWNIRTELPVHLPPEDFGPATLNIVGLRLNPEGPQEPVEPLNIHEAQLKRRLGK